MERIWLVPVIASILILGTLAPAFGIVYNPPIIIPNPTPGADDNFGWSVAISGNNVLVGAPFDDHRPQGIQVVPQLLRSLPGYRQLQRLN